MCQEDRSKVNTGTFLAQVALLVVGIDFEVIVIVCNICDIVCIVLLICRFAIFCSYFELIIRIFFIETDLE